MADQAIPQKGPVPVVLTPVQYRVSSRVLADAKFGDVVELAPTGAVLALVEGGHLTPVKDDRPPLADKRKG